MMRPRTRLGAGLIIISLFLSACAIDYTPHVTPVVWDGGSPESFASTEFDEALAENRNGDPTDLYYEEVYCVARCYRLCVLGECEVFADGTRVQTFISKVDQIQTKLVDLEDAAQSEATFGLGMMGTCSGAVTSLLALTLLDPEPVSKVILGFATFLGMSGGCAGTVIGLNGSRGDIERLEGEIASARIAAEAQFRVLQQESINE